MVSYTITLNPLSAMTAFLWQTAKAAILQRSDEILRMAANWISERLPLSSEDVFKALKHISDMAIKLGDWAINAVETRLFPSAQTAAQEGMYGSSAPHSTDLSQCEDFICAMQAA